MTGTDDYQQPDPITQPAVWRRDMMQKLAQASGMSLRELEEVSARIRKEHELVER